MKVQTVIGNYGYLGEFSSAENFYRNDLSDMCDKQLLSGFL